MLRLLNVLIGLPVILLVLCFALVNRQDVALSFWPTDIQITLPLSLLILGVFLAGVLFGLLWSWFGSLGRRIESYRLRRTLRALQEDHQVVPPASPALPPKTHKLLGVFKR